MRVVRRVLWSSVVVVGLFGFTAGTLHAQGKSKEKSYRVSSNKALTVSRSVLVEHGYHVVRVEQVGATQVIYFRRGNNGRGKGKGPLQRMVIRTVRDRVFFEEAEPSVLVNIDVRLKL
ncbi:MAG: hypothetical protein ABI703_02515 [Gemmatimonadales bacterium]